MVFLFARESETFKNIKVVLGELEESVFIKPSETSQDAAAVWFLQKQTQAKNLQDDARTCERTEMEEVATGMSSGT